MEQISAKDREILRQIAARQREYAESRKNEEILQKCREKGVATNAWTVNKPEMARKLMDWGIDYITTNILE